MYIFKSIGIILFSLFLLSACSDEKPRYILSENSSGQVVKYLEITPLDVTVPLGTSGTYSATAHYENSTNEDVSAKVQWNSSDEKVATIQSGAETPGFAQSHSIGRATITATYDGVLSNEATLYVGDVILESIQLSPLITTVAKGVDVAYSTIAFYSDGSNSDITSFAHFSSSDTNIATMGKTTLDNSIASTIGVGLTNISANYGGKISNSATLNVSSATLSKLEITPIDVRVPKGTTGSYTALAYYSDNSVVDVTRQATWVSFDTSIVRIENGTDVAGFASALSVGSTKIQAKYETLLSNQADVVVTDAVLESIAISPSSKTVAKGVDVQYIALGLYSDGSYVNLTLDATWKSSDSNIATISTKALASTLGVGASTITASFESLVSNSALLNVSSATAISLQITPPSAQVPEGTTGSYTATALYSDNSSEDVTAQATWNSSNDTAVNIITSGAEAGYASALAVGESNITAIFSTLSSNSAHVQVTNAILESIQVTPFISSVANGINVQYSALGIYSDASRVDLTKLVSWRSSETSVALMSAQGLAYSAGVGQSSITAVYENISSNSATLNVTSAVIDSIVITPNDITVPLGTTGMYTALAYYSDSSTLDITIQSTWKSQDSSVVSIESGTSSSGLATALAVGETSISASFEGVSSNTARIQVSSAALENIVISPVSKTVALGIDVLYSATGLYSDGSSSDLTHLTTWISSDTNVSTITQEGLAETLNIGSSNITATFESITSNSALLNVSGATVTSLQITPPSAYVPKGTTGTYLATAFYSDDRSEDVTAQAIWNSTNSTSVNIITSGTQAGYASALEVGESNITATFNLLKSNTAQVAVSSALLESIQITPVLSTVAKGVNVQYSALGYYSDGSSVDLSNDINWRSSASDVAVISASGLAYTSGVGSSIITAVLEGITSNSATLNVSAATIDSIIITPSEANVPKGTTGRYSARAYYSDSSSVDISNVATWMSADTSIVHIDDSGYAQTLSEGNTSIMAHYEGVDSNIAHITVTSASLLTLQITPLVSSVASGLELQYSASGFYSDSTTVDLSKFVIWKSSNTQVSTISALGLAQTSMPGDTNITASIDGINSNVATLNVTSASVASIAISPLSTNVPKGTSGIVMRAIATLSDASTHDVSSEVTWLSSNLEAVTISAQGKADALEVGESNITARYEALVSNIATITVTNAVLESIELTPSTSSVASGVSVLYQALGHYSDNSTQDITLRTNFYSSNLDVAVINTLGLAHTLSVGDSNITATFNSVVSNVATLNVSVAVIKKLEISPADITVPKGSSGRYLAEAYFSDHSILDVTELVLWYSSDLSVVSINRSGVEGGIAKAEAVGSSIITASYNGLASNNAYVEVTAAVLVGIEVYPFIKSVPVGIEVQYSAVGLYSDATHSDLSKFVTWTSSNPSVASIDGRGGKSGVATTLAVGSSSITARYLDINSSSATLNVTAPSIKSIQITPASIGVPKGIEGRFSAVVYYDNNSNEDITTQALWNSSDEGIVTITSQGINGGIARALELGDTNITASFQGVESNSARVEVIAATLESIILTPVKKSIVNGLNQQYLAIGVFSDSSFKDLTSSVNFYSSNNAVADIISLGEYAGLAQSHSVGVTTIYATALDITSNVVELNVEAVTLQSIQITPAQFSLAKGATQNLSATAFYSDGSSADITRVSTWIASDSTKVNVVNAGDDAGLVTALEVGNSDVSATYEGISSTLSKITVIDKVISQLLIRPNNETVILGTTKAFNVFVIYSDSTIKDVSSSVQIESLDASVATFDATNFIQTVGIGTAEMTTSYEGVVSEQAYVHVTAPSLTSIQVTPSNITVPVGTQDSYSATAYYDNNTTANVSEVATWNSTNLDVVSIVTSGTNAGLAEALSEGSSEITATLEGIISNTAYVNVEGKIIDNVQITPNNASYVDGDSAQYYVTVIYVDNSSKDVTNNTQIRSFDTSIATFDSTNMMHTVGVGDVELSTSFEGVVSEREFLHVSAATLDSIQVTPSNVEVPVGTKDTFKATAYYSNATSSDITTSAIWNSSNESVVSVVLSGSNGGQSEALSIGESNITASFNGVESNTAHVLVSGPILEGIHLLPSFKKVIAKGSDIQYEVWAYYNDLSTKEITFESVLSSSDTAVATIETGNAQAGLAYGVSIGELSITAHYEGKSDTAPLEVSAAVISSIQMTPADIEVPLGTKERFTATAYYSDSSSADVTLQSTWLSSSPEIVSIIATGNDAGLAEALLVGTANITASVGSVVSNTARVSVIGSVLESIEILPRAEQSIAKGTSFNYRVVAIYNDLSQVDITTEATLSSSDTSIATIETNNAEAGTAFGIEVGSVSINASYKGIDAVAVSLVVTNAVITSIQVTPAEVTLALGSTQQFQAIAYYSDLSSKDATHVVSWRSSDSDIIEIKSGISSGGYAITGKIGSANISASINSVNSNVADVEVIAPTLESVEIIANDVDFPKGSTVFYTAFAKYSDGSIIEITSSTTWISSDTNIATVSGGEVYGVNVGGSNISIEYESKTDTQAITVRDPIVDYLLLTPSYAEINVGDVRQYLAVAYFTDGSKQDVSLEATWSSSDSDVAHVYIDNNLVNVEAFASGTATITATYNEKSDTSNLVVLNSVTLNSITITPLDETVLIGSTKQFSALANYSDGSVVDITTSSSWASSDTSIATISENQIFGLARGVDVGVTTISALFESVSASTSLNVTNDCGNSKPVSTFILPYNTTVTVATNMQYHLFGLWADGCEMELTYNNANSWSSEDEDIITIGKKDGLSLAVEVGTTNIVAGYQGQSDAISPVTVISAEVLSVSIQPAPSATIARGAAQSYVCSARMAIDGVEQPEEFITGLASYSSSQKLVAVIGVNNGSTQSVDAQNIIGNSTITCYYGGKSSESQLIVE